MGRRSRKRMGAETPLPPLEERPAPRAPARTPRRRARLEEAPPAPWHPFPLVELTILAGLILLVVGFAVGGDSRLPLVAGGFGLVAVASLELTIREHFAGYRSHSSLLGLVAAFLSGVPLALAGVPRAVVVAIAAGVGVGVFLALRTAFAKRAGGLTWRS